MESTPTQKNQCKQNKSLIKVVLQSHKLANLQRIIYQTTA